MDIIEIIDTIEAYFDEVCSEKRKDAKSLAISGNYNRAHIVNIEAKLLENSIFRWELRDRLKKLK